MYLHIDKGWFIYLSALILFLLLAFMASCQRHRSAKTAHSLSLSQIVEQVMDGDYEPLTSHAFHLKPVHFATGSDELHSQEFETLDENALWLRENPKAVIVLEGHCDERGKDQYNMELGDRRARQVKTQLVTRNIAADRLIMVVSYGESRPLDPRHNPAAWEKNRRVEFIVR